MKKTLALLLTLLLVLQLFPASVFAANDTQRSGWTEITDEISLAYFLAEGGRGYLTADVKVTDNLFVYGGEGVAVNAVLDLYGHVIEGTSPDQYSPIYVVEECSLTLMDSRPRAEHTGEYASLPRGGAICYNYVLAADGVTSAPTCITNWGNATINGGNYIGKTTGGDAANEGDYTTIIDNTGVLTINGGSFEATGTTALSLGVSNTGDGNLTINGGTFTCTAETYAQCMITGCSNNVQTTINGGRFSATATDGNAGIFISFAGKWTISGCDAAAVGKKYAAAIYLENDKTDVTVTGGKFKATGAGSEAEVYGIMIESGHVTALGGYVRAIGKGAQGIHQGGTMTLGGNLQVTSTAENLYLAEGKTVTVNNPQNLKPLSVVLESGTGDITAPGSRNYARYFTSADSKYQLQNTGMGSSQVVRVMARESRTNNRMSQTFSLLTGWLFGWMW